MYMKKQCIACHEICKTRLMSYKEGYSENNGVKIFYRDYGPEEATLFF